ncbi:unnamed protein product [Tilletia controversa]|nr:unnamed protein product [Tilletia controversa]
MSTSGGDCMSDPRLRVRNEDLDASPNASGHGPETPPLALIDRIGPMIGLQENADNGSSIDLRLGYPQEMHSVELEKAPLDSVLLTIEGVKKDIQSVSIKVHIQPETPIGAVLRYLHREFGISIYVLHRGEQIDEERTPFELRMYERATVQAEHLLTPVYFNLGGRPAVVYNVVVPVGATLKAVWEREFTGEQVRHPRFLVEGEPWDMRTPLNAMDWDESVVIDVLDEQAGGGPIVGGGAQGWGDLGNGYPAHMHELQLRFPPTNGILIKIEGFPVETQAIILEDTKLGSLLEYFQLEFNLPLTFLYHGEELVEIDTPETKEMRDGSVLQVVYDLERLEEHRRLPSRICATEIQLNLVGIPSQRFDLIVPCEAPLRAIWERHFDDGVVDEPRFLLDGETVGTATLAGMDLRGGAVFDVMPRQVGGGPGTGEGSYQFPENQDQDEDELVSTSAPNVAYREPPAHEQDSEDSIPDRKGKTVRTSTYFAAPATYRPGNEKPQAFCGKGAEVFFEQYESYCNERGYPAPRRFDNLIFFLANTEPYNVLRYARALPQWKTRDYEGVKEELLRSFQESDVDKYTLTDLFTFVQTKRVIGTLDELNKYLLLYKEMANNLKKHGRLTDVSADPTFAQIEKDVRQVFEPTGFYSKFRHNNALERDRRENPDHVRVPSMVPTQNARTGGISDDVQDLTKLMRNLTVNVNALAKLGAGPGPTTPRGPAAAGNTYPNQSTPIATGPRYTSGQYTQAPATDRLRSSYATPYQGDPTRRTNSQPQYGAPPTAPAGCHYCGDGLHGKRQCGLYQKHLVEGVVKEGTDGRMYGPDDTLLWWKPGHMREVAEKKYAEWKATQVPVQANHTQYHQESVNDTQPFFPELEEGPIHVMAESNIHQYHSHNATVSDETTTVKDTNKNPFLVDVNEKRKQAPEQETQGPTKKTRAARGQEDMEQDEDEEEDEVPGEGEATRKRKPQTHRNMSRVDEEHSTAQMVKYSMENGKIQLTWGQFLGMNKEIAREIARQLRPRKVPIVGPIAQANLVEVGDSDDDDDDGAFYTHALPIVEVEAGGKRYKALIDTGSELDMISLRVFRDLGVPLRKDGIHKVVGINNLPERLYGCCERFKISIGGIANTINPFVRDGLSYDMLLGMPTIARFGMHCWAGTDGQAWIELKSNRGVKVQILSVKRDNPRNMTRLPANFGRPPPARVDSEGGSDSSY